jgi:heme-degrading monooxygenase HmoA
MIMTVRIQSVPAQQMDEVVRRVDLQWLEKIRHAPGFVSTYVVRRGNDQLVFLTAFLDEDSAHNGIETSAEWFGQWFMDLDAEPPELWDGTVVAHTG